MLKAEQKIGMTLEEDYKANYLSGSLGQKRLANRWGVNRNQIFGQHRDGRRNWVQMLSLPSRPALGTQLPPQIVTSPGLSPTQQPSGQQRHFKIRTEFSSPTMLSTLRQKVTGEQRALLDIIWEEFVETGTWPETFKIHRKLHKEKVTRCLRGLSGHIVWESDDSMQGRYELTLLGAVLATRGPDLFSLLVRFTEFLRDKYVREEGDLSFSDEDVSQALGLGDQQRLLLGRLSSLDPDFRANIQKSGRWAILVPKIIEDAPRTGPLASFREDLILRLYKPNIPVFASERHAAQIASARPHVSPGQSEDVVPPELAESLKKFKEDHPDKSKSAFVMMRFGKTKAHTAILETLRKTLGKHGITALRADDKDYHDDLFWNILTFMHGCGFGVAVLERIEQEHFNPNISLEIGYMLALGKPILLLKDKTLQALNTDLIGRLYKTFDPQAIQETIAPEVERWLKDKNIIQHR